MLRIALNSVGTVLPAAMMLLLIGCSSTKPVPAQPVELGNVQPAFQAEDIYFGGQPSGDDWEVLKDRGVRSILDLRMPGERPGPEQPIAESHGLEYVNMPFTPKTFSKDHVDEFAAMLETMPRPILIHCGSSNRVGGLWASHLILNEDFDIEQAMSYGRLAGLRKASMIEAVERVTGSPAEEASTEQP